MIAGAITLIAGAIIVIAYAITPFAQAAAFFDRGTLEAVVAPRRVARSRTVGAAR